ncbi:MAG: rRNA pseudouridine synthase [Lentisphaeria bacterium]|nr:rRNA pseudouridine synthase [Lentisphaeria bacterium]
MNSDETMTDRDGGRMTEEKGGAEKEMNLAKFLSAAGVCARRAAEGVIREGRVFVNGVQALRAAQHVTEKDSVTFDGKEIKPVKEFVYFLLHKPRGYVCTLEDPHAKKKAVDLIPKGDYRVVSAGRLDKDSEGMILFSNDGSFVEKLTHPRYGICKTYEVSLDSPLSEQDVSRLLSGVREGGDLLKAQAIRHLHDCKYEIVLGEGKNREIRRMMNVCRKETKRLKRIAVGALFMKNLPPGETRRLTKEEAFLALKEKPLGKRE